MSPREPGRQRRRDRTEPSAETAGLPARRGALALLSAVIERGAQADEAHLPAGLEPEARAEARGLADLVLRRLGQIDALLANRVERTPHPPAREILRLMAGELAFAGTAPHAAVDLAVRLAHGTRGAERLSGLVNAVGRRLAEGGAGDVARTDPATNAPDWLRHALAEAWGRGTAAAILAAHLEPAPHDLTLREPSDAEAIAAETGARILPSGTLRLPGRPQISALPGYADGAWWVQDAAAALPVLLLDAARPVAGLRVLDLCAAPGGKTLQLAALGAEVTAIDQNARRMERLRENLARTGLAARTVTADALGWEPDATFDAILLDAPCSATGTIRRHPDLPWRFDPDGLGALVELQAALLDRAAAWLAPDGQLVFATCSLLPDEGEAQIDAFLERRRDFRLVPAAETDWLPPDTLTSDGTLRTLPSMLPEIGGLDGFFAAILSH